MKLSKLVITLAALGLVAACSGGDKAPAEKKAAPAAAKAPAAPAAPAEPAGEPGNVKITVKYEGTAPARAKLDRSADPYCAKSEALSEDLIVNGDGTITNAVVYVKKVRGKFDAPAATLKLTQNACTYSPHVQTGMKGQSIEISNSDKTLHNVHSYKGAKKKNWFNIAQPPGAPAKTEKLKKAELSTFKCDVHPWMSSYVVTTENPFNGVTGDTGSVTLEGVPSKAKAYDIITWHETLGEQIVEVIVEAGKTAEVTVTYKGG